MLHLAVSLNERGHTITQRRDHHADSPSPLCERRCRRARRRPDRRHPGAGTRYRAAHRALHLSSLSDTITDDIWGTQLWLAGLIDDQLVGPSALAAAAAADGQLAGIAAEITTANGFETGSAAALSSGDYTDTFNYASLAVTSMISASYDADTGYNALAPAYALGAFNAYLKLLLADPTPANLEATLEAGAAAFREELVILIDPQVQYEANAATEAYTAAIQTLTSSDDYANAAAAAGSDDSVTANTDLSDGLTAAGNANQAATDAINYLMSFDPSFAAAMAAGSADLASLGVQAGTLGADLTAVLTSLIP